MKKALFRLIYAMLCLLFGAAHVSAKVWIVDNNNNAAADFSSLQAAIDHEEIQNGDTLYLTGSTAYYDGAPSEVRLHKTLTIIGPGYFLQQNEQTPFNKNSAKVFQLFIENGADNSVIMGLEFTLPMIIGGTQFGAEPGPTGIRLLRNLLKGIFVNAREIEIRNNFVQGNITLRGGSRSIFIANNIFTLFAIITAQSGGQSIPFQDTYITGNTFRVQDWVIRYLSGVEITDNLFYGTIRDCSNILVRNNVFTLDESTAIVNSTAVSASNNLFSVREEGLLLNVSLAYDAHYMLGPESAARKAGTNGIDAGAFGGPTPYVPAGLPPIPAIYELSTSGLGNQQSGIRVNIKVQSNP